MPPSASPRKPRLTREAAARKRAAADRAHEKYVQKTYGLEPGQYAEMLERQNGRCAICTRLPVRRRLAVDHDHNTGAIRALLCHTCNYYVLRYVEGDPIASHNAAIYLANIARDYGPGYDPMPAPLVEADSPTRRELRLPPLRAR
jgi:hypothetical protein